MLHGSRGVVFSKRTPLVAEGKSNWQVTEMGPRLLETRSLVP
jgi:hypothetical protein